MSMCVHVCMSVCIGVYACVTMEGSEETGVRQRSKSLAIFACQLSSNFSRTILLVFVCLCLCVATEVNQRVHACMVVCMPAYWWAEEGKKRQRQDGRIEQDGRGGAQEDGGLFQARTGWLGKEEGRDLDVGLPPGLASLGLTICMVA